MLRECVIWIFWNSLSEIDNLKFECRDWMLYKKRGDYTELSINGENDFDIFLE